MIGPIDYWSWTGLFSKETCKAIVDAYYKNENSAVAAIGSPSTQVSVSPHIRKTQLCWISPDEHISTILLNKALIANQKAGWGYDVDFVEPVQVGSYDVGSHYDWHSDTSLGIKENGTQRKLSVVVMLSDPNDYEGGNLEFNQEHPTAVPKVQGSVYVFPSWALHRVTEVTKGHRYTLAAWCRGPAFR
jgi:PKHD-type hydroxylase